MKREFYKLCNPISYVRISMNRIFKCYLYPQQTYKWFYVIAYWIKFANYQSNLVNPLIHTMMTAQLPFTAYQLVSEELKNISRRKKQVLITYRMKFDKFRWSCRGIVAKTVHKTAMVCGGLRGVGVQGCLEGVGGPGGVEVQFYSIACGHVWGAIR